MAVLRVASVNVNGIRAAVRNGMHAWLETADVDVLTLQEVRGQDEHLEAAFPGWSIAHIESPMKGRAGVAIVSRTPPQDVRTALGDGDFDSTGRWIEADFDFAGRPLTIVSAYVHTGEAGTPKQDDKWRMLDAIEARLPQLSAADGHALLTGDLNVGHRELDIKNWKGNLKKAGFLPRERAYFDRFLESGWVDIGRRTHGEVPGPYTWWSMRGKAFDNDAGWRIDYHLASPALADHAENYQVHRAPSYAQRWSDHAPVIADYRAP